jgi:ribosomal-protein-alanine N-acetyltransferase
MLHPDTFLVCCNANRSPEEVLCYIIFSKNGHLISIAVHPRYRRKGIGTHLLRKVMDTPHLKKVWAEVRRSNVSAQSFYSKLEFKTVGIVPKYYGNEDALIVQWNPDLTQ